MPGDEGKVAKLRFSLCGARVAAQTLAVEYISFCNCWDFEKALFRVAVFTTRGETLV